MSAKGTAPEADLLRVPVPRSRSAKLAQLFVEWTSQHPLKIIVAFVILTFTLRPLCRPAFFDQHRRQRLDLSRSPLAATGAGL